MYDDKARERQRRYQQRHSEKLADKKKQYREANPKRTAFNKQKHHAKKRGIPFLITLDEWIEWWGDDFDKRGKGALDLHMGRREDTGPYELDNIIKITASENHIQYKEQNDG